MSKRREINDKNKRVMEIMSMNGKTEWCVVDVDNEFWFDSDRYVIDESVSEYKVLSKYNEVEDYNNYSKMEKILAVKKGDSTFFYNQNYVEVKKITKKEEI